MGFEPITPMFQRRRSVPSLHFTPSVIGINELSALILTNVCNSVFPATNGIYIYKQLSHGVCYVRRCVTFHSSPVIHGITVQDGWGAEIDGQDPVRTLDIYICSYRSVCPTQCRTDLHFCKTSQVFVSS
jgi:hypothetical protein